MHEPLPDSFYARDAVQVAHEILAKRLVRVTAEGATIGRIVEAEAYLAHDDPANHAHRGQTRRNASMFGPPGHAYVYAIHARFCLNVVTERVGVPSAVLIRAVEPVDGVELMRQRRGTSVPRNLTRGPARLCEAFAIDRSLDGWDLTRGEELWVTVEPSPAPQAVQIATAPRVGVTAAQDLPLRFFITGNQFVSKPPRGQGR